MLTSNDKKEIIELANEVISRNSDPNPEYMKVKIDKYPHIFFLGFVMDRQIPYEKAFNIPHVIAEEIGHDFNAFASKDEEFYIDFFNTRKLLRFNEQMAKCLYFAIQKI